jgi:hypothetical protein
MTVRGVVTNLKVNPPLFTRLSAIQLSLMAAHESGRGLPSNTIGREREVFIRNFLALIYPPPFRFSSGAIVDAKGQLSGQLDIVVERQFAPSFTIPGSEERLFLTDNVAIVLEVKSNLTSQWDEVRATTAKIKNLTYQHIYTGMVIGDRVEKIPVFAAGYKGHSTADSLEAMLLNTAPEERPDGALVIDSGCFVCSSPLGFYKGCGPTGIYGFVCLVNRALISVSANSPNMMGYAAAPEKASVNR